MLGIVPYTAPASGMRCRRIGAALLTALSTACSSLPARAPLDPSHLAQDFAVRRLDALPDLPPLQSGWNAEQWFRAALELNPELAEARAAARAAAAGEVSAAERPNPTLNLFAEYVTAAAQSAGWLYGLSMEFLLPQRGVRARARESAALQTQAAQSDVADTLWRVRSLVQQALLDAAYANDATALLQSLVADRQALLAANRTLAQAGEIASSETLIQEVELARARQRLVRSQALATDAQVRLAGADAAEDLLEVVREDTLLLRGRQPGGAQPGRQPGQRRWHHLAQNVCALAAAEDDDGLLRRVEAERLARGGTHRAPQAHPCAARIRCRRHCSAERSRQTLAAVSRDTGLFLGQERSAPGGARRYAA